MTILNIMLGARRGGIEQAAVDYAEALTLAGYDVLTVTTPGAWVNDALGDAPRHALRNAGAWDPLARLALRKLARAVGATATICHGNRALGLALGALDGRVPVIATAHNYKTRRFPRAAAALCITERAMAHLAERMPREKLFFIPNMTRPPLARHGSPRREPPVIGSMGRFVAKKGYALMVDALALLKQRGVAFTAVIGGGGEEEDALRAHIAARGLRQQVALPGWVEDKYAFFDGMDIFVLPSHHEPFGIVLIEAMGYGMPVVSTRSEGPVEIITDGMDGLLTPLADAEKLADALARLIAAPDEARRLGDAARQRVLREYSPEAMARRLKDALTRIISAA